MDKLQLLKKVKSLTLYTGTYGRRKFRTNTKNYREIT